ncbi:MAG: vWA domain-containing protein [Promethearchaeota archaeon]
MKPGEGGASRPPNDPGKEKRLRLAGKISEKDLLELEIVKQRKSASYFKNAATRLNHSEIMELTRSAVLHNNMEAVSGFAQSNKYAVASSLFSPEGMDFLQYHAEKSGESSEIPRLYLMLQRNAPPHYKEIFRRLARQTVIRTSLKISGRGLRGTIPKRAPYYPGMPEFDLPRTIERYLERRILTYDDIVGVTRRKKKKNGVLIMDTSGSMYGDTLLNAALTTAVLAYHMRDDFFSIVVFNNQALVVKDINRSKSVGWIVDQILDSEAAGFTNISLGLKKGLQELRKIRGREKFGIIVTDGAFNRGGDPKKVAREYPRLHVIGMPNNEPHLNGERTCRRMARAANSKYIPVTSYREIPRALVKLLYEL